MQTTRKRVAKLEQRVNAPQLAGKLVVVRCGVSEVEVSKLLARQGIDEANLNHTIVVLRTLFEDRSGAISPSQRPAEILSIMDKQA
jgi:hypothetical protein